MDNSKLPKTTRKSFPMAFHNTLATVARKAGVEGAPKNVKIKKKGPSAGGSDDNVVKRVKNSSSRR